MSGLELKVPPVAVTAIVAALMWVASLASPPLAVPAPLRTWLSAALVSVAAAVMVLAILSFRGAHTTVDPTKPERAEHLVETGPYRFTRNPMYLGMLLVLLAWAVLLATVQSLVVAAVFVPYMGRFQIGPEERALSVAFGQEYADFTARVRRWL